LPVVLHGFKTWSLILKEVFENRVLRRIFGPTREEIAGDLKKALAYQRHNTSHILDNSPNN